MTSRSDYISLGGSSAEADALGLVNEPDEMPPSRSEMGDDNYYLSCRACEGSGCGCPPGSSWGAPCVDCPECDGTGRVAA